MSVSRKEMVYFINYFLPMGADLSYFTDETIKKIYDELYENYSGGTENNNHVIKTGKFNF